MTHTPAEQRIRDELVTVAASLFTRGLTGGSSGNISVRLQDGYLMTPTGSSLGRLDPDRLSTLDDRGRHLRGDQPTKEAALHLAMFRRRPSDAAIVHLHSPHATAVSCLDNLDADNCLPPLTAYHVMRVGSLPLIAYHPPGDPAIVDAIATVPTDRHALLLANHGPIVSAGTLGEAANITEELEQTSRIFLLLGPRAVRPLTPTQVTEVVTVPHRHANQSDSAPR